jgi:hypothetical protein
MNSVKDKFVHLAIRFPLMAKVGGQQFNIVDAHNEVVTRVGCVAFAKFGKPGTNARIAQLRRQIENGNSTLLILIMKRGANFIGFQSQMSAVHLGRPTSQIAAVRPSYYEKIYENPELWFVVNRPFAKADLKSIRLASNGRPLLDVLRDSRTASMLVENGS